MKIVEATYQQRIDKLVALANGDRQLVLAALKQYAPKNGIPTDATVLEPPVHLVIKYIKEHMKKPA